MISMLITYDLDHCIGLVTGGKPWVSETERKFINDVTKDKDVLFGWNTFIHMVEQLDDIPGKHTVVMTDKCIRELDMIYNLYHLSEHDVSFCSCLDTLLKSIPQDNELVVCGGLSLFEQVGEIADRYYITKINHIFDGDVFYIAPESLAADINLVDFKTSNDDYHMIHFTFERGVA